MRFMWSSSFASRFCTALLSLLTVRERFVPREEEALWLSPLPKLSDVPSLLASAVSTAVAVALCRLCTRPARQPRRAPRRARRAAA